jgi:hypothetical protein
MYGHSDLKSPIPQSPEFATFPWWLPRFYRECGGRTLVTAAVTRIS